MFANKVNFSTTLFREMFARSMTLLLFKNLFLIIVKAGKFYLIDDYIGYYS